MKYNLISYVFTVRKANAIFYNVSQTWTKSKFKALFRPST